jgi:hypothetical protein
MSCKNMGEAQLKSNSFISSRIKVERARKILTEFGAEIEDFTRTGGMKVIVRSDNGTWSYVYEQPEPIPCEWSAIIGDIIHNSRASLDLMMVDIVKNFNPGITDLSQISFVVREKKSDFIKDLPRNARGISENAMRVIESLEPYTGGNDDIVTLHKLDIIDKHRSIIPVGAAQFNSTFQWDLTKLPIEEIIVGNKILDIPIGFQKNVFPLKNGDVIISMPDPTDLPEYFPRIGQIGLTISFGIDDVVGGEPIIETLQHFCDMAEAILDYAQEYIE